MKITSATQLGRTVQALRRALKVSQADLAMAAGTNRRFIIDLERGKPTTQLAKVLQVLATLGASVVVEPPSGVKLPLDIQLPGTGKRS
ncbi:MAG TPA: helix-turn-helix domain-containing protein [Candidatus Binatia bacterium]|jgi:y4mF family transcriptional regulator|nr:helix-turn-helix domain-containing protein [Candidatus Binatia bacterium]